MIKPQQQFFIADAKIHTVRSSQCIIPPPASHIYEVFRVISGVPLFIEDHLIRLQNSLDSASIVCEANTLLPQITQLITINSKATGNIKIIIWVSEEKKHHMMFYDQHAYPTEQQFLDGVNIGILNSERLHPNVKLFDPDMRTKAAGLIAENNVYEILLQNNEGFVTEGSRSNIFFIHENQIFTPPSNQVLEGVTRKKIIEIINNQNIPFKETPIILDEVTNFDSIFITGTSRRVLPVKQIIPIEKQFNAAHPLIRNLQADFLNLCTSYIQNKRV